MSDTNTVNYFEIGTSDPQAACTFYGQLFGWQFAAANAGGYAAVNGGAGGLWDTSDTGGESWAVFYVEVADIRATMERAIEQGAQTVRPLVDNGVILFAHLADPAGNRFGVWQRKAAV